MTGLPFLMWAHVLLIWSIAAYITRDPVDDESLRSARHWRVWVLVRSLAAGIGVGLLSGAMWLSILVFACSLLLPFARSRIPARHCAELEISANVVLAAASLVFVQRNALQLERALFALPVTNNRIAAACIVMSLFLFTIHGGTYVVRGVLKKSGAVPMIPAIEGERKIDMKEFNRGRLIGALERVLLFAVVIAGSYEALGFIVAAKGLVRSREFEVSRDMTEYFLIGSLASVLVALATGTLARYVIRVCW
ncbi:MAG TPA: hypothetical protein VGQ36_04620 [Thermoanaerobaculia bacterium]|jgi:hypothetical protein|nr:hypothetical protein [Thermoanaerobaculia bacterium]